MLVLPFKDPFPIVNIECNLCIYLNNMCKQQASNIWLMRKGGKKAVEFFLERCKKQSQDLITFRV